MSILPRLAAESDMSASELLEQPQLSASGMADGT